MKTIQKLIIVISLVIFATNVFADGMDWVAFPDENINTYPIIFGNIKDSERTTIACGNNNFSPSTFKPSLNNSEIDLSAKCIPKEGNLFFYIGNLNSDNSDNSNKFQSIIAKNLFSFYFINTNIKIENKKNNQDQNLTLTFPFKLS